MDRVRAAAIAFVGVLLAGCAGSSAHDSARAAAGLSSAFAAVSLPQGAARLSSGAHQSPLPLGHAGNARVSYEDWSSPISMNATVAWITAHMPTGWSPGDLDKYNLGRNQEWDGPVNAQTDGPNLTITVTAKGKGAVVEVAAWTMPLDGKPAKELLSEVTGATAHVTNDNGSYVKPFSLTLTLAQAQRFAADINALSVAHPVTTTGLAGFPDVTLSFQTAHGPRTFLAIRNAYLVQSLGGGPDLIMSGSLEHELSIDIPKGESSRPPTDRHPVLPQHITSITIAADTTRVVPGTELTQLVADLRPLPEDPQAGTCTKKGQPQVDFTVHGSDGDRRFTYFGNCDEVSPLDALDGQLVVPFTASPAFEADIARLLAKPSG